MTCSLISSQTLPASADPITTSKDFRIEKIVDGLHFPTTMAFLNSHDFLILEKNNGTVRQYSSGKLMPVPLIDENVSIGEGRGLYGIAIKNTKKHSYIYLSFLQSGEGDVDEFRQGKSPKGNVVYRYELVNGKLIDPLLIQTTPGTPGPFHYGGVLSVGPDGNIYHVVGDTGPPLGVPTKAQNILNGANPDGTSGIVRFDQNGKLVSKGILGKNAPLNSYYAYGIRNSFGMAFDPISGQLWDTENGPEYSDELNLVMPGFNSGWRVIQGEASDFHLKFDSALGVDEPNNSSLSSKLVSFNGAGKYRDPEFVWDQPIGVTSLVFLNSDKYGKDLKNDLFVGDVNNGYIYHFDLNPSRTHLILNGSLDDRRANNPSEAEKIIFAKGFNGITDLKVSPDGYLYVVSHLNGAVYKILPSSPKSSVS